MKFERLKQLMAQNSLSVKEMRERDQLVNELLPLLVEVAEYSWDNSALKDLEEA